MSRRGRAAQALTIALVACGGSGAATSSSSGSSAAASAASSSSGSLCETATLTVRGDGADQTFASSCAGDWGSDQTKGPVAYVQSGPAAHLVIEGCANGGAAAPRLELEADGLVAPGTTQSGASSYRDRAGVVWTGLGGAFEMTLKEYDAAPGGVARGSFVVSVAKGGPSRALAGDFVACRVPDPKAP